MRCFVALAIPDAVRSRLHALRDDTPGVRWVRPENLHVTLRFIGEVDPGTAARLEDELTQLHAPALTMQIRGGGTFGRPPRVLWASLEPPEPVTALAARVESAVQRAGLEPEARPFRAHLTLARLKRAGAPTVERALARIRAFACDPFAVSSFELMQSHLGPDGPRYASRASFPLEASEG